MNQQNSDGLQKLHNVIKDLEQVVTQFENQTDLPISFFSEAFESVIDVLKSLNSLYISQLQVLKNKSASENFISDTSVQLDASLKQNVPVQQETLGQSDVYAHPDASLKPDTLVQPDIPDSPEPIFRHDTPIIEETKILHERDAIDDFFHDGYIKRDDSTKQGGPFKHCDSDNRSGSILLNDSVNPNSSYRNKQLFNHAGAVVADMFADSKSLEGAIGANFSLNDRFLFQRELFNNNASEMHDFMQRLNSFPGFEYALEYIKSNRDWDFDSESVKRFLEVIKKNF